jgi:hypothetical protein
MCQSCVGRRTFAFVQVVKKGRSILDVAVRLQLPPARVELLVEQERERRSRPLFKTSPLLADAQWFIEDALRRDPFLTRAEIARRMKPEMCQADFDKTFGYPRRRDRRQRFITEEMGGRLMLALGRDPHELPGC